MACTPASTSETVREPSVRSRTFRDSSSYSASNVFMPGNCSPSAFDLDPSVSVLSHELDGVCNGVEDPARSEREPVHLLPGRRAAENQDGLETCLDAGHDIGVHPVTD